VDIPHSRKEEVGLVLLHGSGLGSWIWEPVLPLLELPALSADLPGRGSKPVNLRTLTPEDAVQSVISDIEGWGPGRVVLVAHSFSGPLALGVASRLRNRGVGIVFLGAAIPPAGKPYLSLLPPLQRVLLRSFIGLSRGGIRPPDRVIRASIGNDLGSQTGDMVVSRVVPEAPGLFTRPTSWDLSLVTHQRFYVQLMLDRSGVSSSIQEQAIAQLQPIEVFTLDSGHLPMLSCPTELASILNSVAKRVFAPISPS
jgi:pimeloyl-ACP methyl ester carboxylesterase